MNDDNIISRTRTESSKQDKRESAHPSVDEHSRRTDQAETLTKPEEKERRQRQAPAFFAAGNPHDQRNTANSSAERRGPLAATEAERLEKLEQALVETQRKLWEARWEIYDLKLELLLLKKTCDRE